MRHFTLPQFWQFYDRLPKHIQSQADKNYELLKRDPFHPSLHFKKISGKRILWSVRIGEQYRALGMDKPEGIVWIWIGTHSEYDKLLK